MRKVEKILVPIDFPKSPRERYCSSNYESGFRFPLSQP
jgi:hypothetical protein